MRCDILSTLFFEAKCRLFVTCHLGTHGGDWAWLALGGQNVSMEPVLHGALYSLACFSNFGFYFKVIALS
jgi:hypothetical protein